MRDARGAPPADGHQWIWRYRGGGLEGLGTNGRAEWAPRPSCPSNGLVARVDALGICASDAKMVVMGQDYPLFFERDFDRDPAVLGHEVSLTVVEVGDAYRHRFQVGMRLGLQPDVFAEGRRMIVGVNLDGGMAQFVVLDASVLGASEETGYVFPVDPTLTHAAVALSEPWACVDVAYRPGKRLDLAAGGRAWLCFADGIADLAGTMLLPSSALVTSQPFAACRERAPHATVLNEHARTPEAAVAAIGGGRFDDVVLVGTSSAEQVEAALGVLKPGGLLVLLLASPLDAEVAVEPNRIHYDGMSVIGAVGRDLDVPFEPGRYRSDLASGGAMLVLGAAGTMGRMHVLRALEQPQPPRSILVTNRDRQRLDDLLVALQPLADLKGVRLEGWSPTRDASTLAEVSRAVTDGHGFDDVIVVAPSGSLIADAMAHAAPAGTVNVFAGLRKNACVRLPLDRVATDAVHLFGTSGSSTSDQVQVLARVRDGARDPHGIIAAVGGIHAVKDAVRAVIGKRFGGKIVLYPQLEDLGLHSLSELATERPELAPLLRDGDDPTLRWSARAERALLGTDG